MLMQVEGGYRPRFGLDPAVIRLPIIPGSDPRIAYGDLVARGVKGVVLEAFGALPPFPGKFSLAIPTSIILPCLSTP